MNTDPSLGPAQTPDPGTTDPVESPCPACDTARAAGARFCPQCGSDLSITQLDSASVEAPERSRMTPGAVDPDDGSGTQTDDSRPVQTTEQPSAPATCPCGHDLPDDASFCPCCGVPVEPSASADLCLVYTDSDKKTHYVPLGGNEITIGKDPGCELVLADDAYVSRRHARLSRDNELLLVEDLASANGTLLRVRRPMVIEPGDEILIGTSLLRLEKRGG